MDKSLACRSYGKTLSSRLWFSKIVSNFPFFAYFQSMIAALSTLIEPTIMKSLVILKGIFIFKPLEIFDLIITVIPPVI